MFNNLKTDGVEEQQDVLGGGSGTVESGVYPIAIDAVYAGKSGSSQAQSVTVLGKYENGFKFQETFWVTNKTGLNTYQDKKDPNKKHLLPGYAMVNDLAMLAVETPLNELAWEEKTLNIYNFDLKKEVPTQVQVATALTGTTVKAAVIKRVVDKNVKQPDGSYAPGGDTREENVTDKFFHAETGLTLVEAKAGMSAGDFITKWAEKNTGKTQNRAKGAAGKTGGPAGTSGGAKKSLFGAK